MQFSTLRRLILILFIALNIGDAYGNDPKKSKDKSNGSTSDSDATHPNQLPELIKLDLSSFHRHNKGKERFTLFVYEIKGECKSKDYRKKLKHPNRIGHFQFNDKLLVFEDPTKVPDRNNWVTVAVFGCRHNQPVMLRIKISENGKDYHHYYKLDTKTKALVSTSIDSLDEKPEPDKSGLTRHPIPPTGNNEDYCKKLDKGWSKALGSPCKGHKSSKEKIENPSLKILIIPPGYKSNLGDDSYSMPDLIKTTPIYNYSHTVDPNFSILTYPVNKEVQKKLKRPNKIEYVQYNGKMMLFNGRAKFPNLDACSFIILYLCRHKYPMMIALLVTDNKKSYRYYYTLDLEARTLVNTEVNFLNQQPEFDDKNKLTRYEVIDIDEYDDLIYNNISEDWYYMFGDLCNGHKPSEIGKSAEDNDLKICYLPYAKKSGLCSCC